MPTTTLAISNDYVTTPAICMDEKGDVIALWTQLDGVYASVFNVESKKWQPNIRLSKCNLGNVADNKEGNPSIQMDKRGNAYVVWKGNNRIYYCCYDALTKVWSFPISLYEGKCYCSQIAVDPNGNVIVCWFNAESNNIQLTRYNSSQKQWSQIKDITVAYSKKFPIIKLRVDDHSNGLIIWSQSDLPLMAIYYDSTTDVLKEPIEITNVYASGFDGAFKDNGNAVIIWGQNASLCSIELDKNLSQYLEKHENIFLGIIPHIKINESAFVISCISSSSPFLMSTVWDEKKHFYSGKYLISDALVFPFQFDCGLDRYGNALVAWNERSGNIESGFILTTKAAFFDATLRDWTSPFVLSKTQWPANKWQNLCMTVVAVNPKGNTAVLWEGFDQIEQKNTIYVAIYMKENE